MSTTLDCPDLPCADSIELGCFLRTQQQREMEMHAFYHHVWVTSSWVIKGCSDLGNKKLNCRFWTGSHLVCKSPLCIYCWVLFVSPLQWLFSWLLLLHGVVSSKAVFVCLADTVSYPQPKNSLIMDTEEHEQNFSLHPPPFLCFSPLRNGSILAKLIK